MDGVADLGGMQGFGAVSRPEPEPVFSERWEARAFALGLLSMRTSGTNLDSFRHALDRQHVLDYFADGYFGRWCHAAETLLVDSAILAPGAVEARTRNLMGQQVPEPAIPAPSKPDYKPTAAGSLRPVDVAPGFAVGQPVRVRDAHPPRHTRMPRYVRGRRGVIERIQPSALLPDTHATFEGENPQHVYAVSFDSTELWGPDAERFTLIIDLWESYLQEAPNE
jgi:nitrile hydratase beta subunit